MIFRSGVECCCWYLISAWQQGHPLLAWVAFWEQWLCSARSIHRTWAMMWKFWFHSVAITNFQIWFTITLNHSLRPWEIRNEIQNQLLILWVDKDTLWEQLFFEAFSECLQPSLSTKSLQTPTCPPLNPQIIGIFQNFFSLYFSHFSLHPSNPKPEP